MNKRISIRIFGKVQEVFFRHNTKLFADELGIYGLARNEADGHVLIIAEGDEDKIDKLISWLKKGGPKSADIEHVDVCEEEYKGDFSYFEII